jgi:hypothetical protein
VLAHGEVHFISALKRRDVSLTPPALVNAGLISRRQADGMRNVKGKFLALELRVCDADRSAVLVGACR